ncbi:MAG TPA: hypothetical protein VJQ54_02040, partial [Candidatus Sulfotelmatobacter sp.]|nr:hypothetical protein [Candidatus Sulfotelmatobacter sp.]
MENTEIMNRFIHEAVQKALANSRLPYDHPIGAALEGEAQIVGQTACVRVLDRDGNWVMLEKRIEELKSDQRFRDSLPSPIKIGRSDESRMRDNFDKVATGEAIIE